MIRFKPDPYLHLYIDPLVLVVWNSVSFPVWSRTALEDGMSARITWYRFQVVLLVLWIIVVFVDARPERLYKSCGQPLSIRISRVCSGKYYGKWGSYNNLNMVTNLDILFTAAPSQGRRVRRGIVDDCCKNRCTDSHVKQYCTTPAPADVSPTDLEEEQSAELPLPVYRFHFEDHPSPREDRAEVTTVPPLKSKVLIGRVPTDYINSWTYTG